jgi:hypothetical protein
MGCRGRCPAPRGSQKKKATKRKQAAHLRPAGLHLESREGLFSGGDAASGTRAKDLAGLFQQYLAILLSAEHHRLRKGGEVLLIASLALAILGQGEAAALRGRRI